MNDQYEGDRDIWDRAERELDFPKLRRNAMRILLWGDPRFAHRWLCHPDRECPDGCDIAPLPFRFELYQSDLEEPE
jgi:hypothetical protein